jgi:tripartite-type tricarboxylate transporter receptor subunit TctC
MDAKAGLRFYVDGDRHWRGVSTRSARHGETFMKRAMSSKLAMLFVALVASVAVAARADEFYAGKTVTLFAGQPPGGGIDAEMRLVAANFSRFIPGEPRIQPGNMPGAGGIQLGNHLYTIAAPDGLTLGMPGRAGFVLATITDEKIARYDVRNFTWIGSAASTNFLFWTRADSGLRDLAALRASKREIIVAASGSTTANSIIPEVLAKYEGFKFRVVRGYLGIADAVLAVERGEADAIYCDRASLRPDMVTSGLVTPVFQTFADRPGVPTIDELLTDPLERRLIRLLTTPMRLGLAVVAPPGLPSAFAGQLRDAYARMASSDGYREQATARGFEIGPVNRGEDLERQVREAFAATSSDVIDEYRALVAKH